jgi:hypothetical protein
MNEKLSPLSHHVAEEPELLDIAWLKECADQLGATNETFAQKLRSVLDYYPLQQLEQICQDIANQLESKTANIPDLPAAINELKQKCCYKINRIKFNKSIIYRTELDKIITKLIEANPEFFAASISYQKIINNKIYEQQNLRNQRIN